MMRSAKIPLLISLFAIAASLGCKKEPDYKTKTYVSRSMNTVTSDVPLPDGLWTQIEKVADEAKGIGAPGGAAGHGEAAEKPAEKAAEHGEKKAEHGEAKSEHGKPRAQSATGEVPSKFMGIKVYLIEDTPGILGGKNYRLEYGEGGGELDLKDFLADKTGNFKIAIEALLPLPLEKTDEEIEKEEAKKKAEEEHKAESAEHAPEGGGEHGEAPKAEAPKAAPAEIPAPGALKVFYLSNAVRRKYDGEVLGGGCRNYYDITTFFTDSMKKDGIPATTVAARHASALAGTYFFAQGWASRVYLAHLTIKDSRFKDLQCKTAAKTEKTKH